MIRIHLTTSSGVFMFSLPSPIEDSVSIDYTGSCRLCHRDIRTDAVWTHKRQFCSPAHRKTFSKRKAAAG